MSPALRRVAAVGLAALLLLSACAGDARGDLRRAVADLTAAANGRDADGVREGVQTVLDRLDAAQRSEDVTPQQAAVIRERAMAVLAAADSIDDDVIARREAERAAEEAEKRLEAEREAAAEAERQRIEEERRQAEQEAQAEEEARKAEEERRKAEEEAAEKARQEAEREAEKEAEKAEKEAEKDAEEEEQDEAASAPRGPGLLGPGTAAGT